MRAIALWSVMMSINIYLLNIFQINNNNNNNFLYTTRVVHIIKYVIYISICAFCAI